MALSATSGVLNNPNLFGSICSYLTLIEMARIERTSKTFRESIQTHVQQRPTLLGHDLALPNPENHEKSLTRPQGSVWQKVCRMKRLTCVDLTAAPSIVEFQLIEIVQHARQTLCTLRICARVYDVRIEEIERPQTIIASIATCTVLQELELGDAFTQDAEHLVPLCKLKQLNTLTLSGSKVADAHLDVVRRITTLTSVRLPWYMQITDQGIQALLISLSGLRHLDVSRKKIKIFHALDTLKINQINGVARSIAQRGQNLHTLDMSRSSYSMESVLAIAEQCPQLRFLDITDCYDEGTSTENLSAAAEKTGLTIVGLPH